MSLKAVLVGFGNIAEMGHLPTYMEHGIEVVAVVDVCSKRRQKAKNCGLEVYKKIEEVDQKADFLDLCTPPNYRLEALEYAKEKGLDVICEKPISRVDDFQRTREIIASNSFFFFPVHNWKYAPHYRLIKELVKENGIRKMEMSTLRTGYNHGNPDWDPDWRIKREISGGGILMDHGYHNIYLAMYLMGKDFEDAKLNDIKFFPGAKVERKASFELFFPEKVKVSLDWCADKREVKNTIYSDGSIIQVLDDRVIVDGEEQFMGGISRDSVHRDWFASAFKDFLILRKNGGDVCGNEGLRVMEALTDLYAQSNGS